MTEELSNWLGPLKNNSLWEPYIDNCIKNCIKHCINSCGRSEALQYITETNRFKGTYITAHTLGLDRLGIIKIAHKSICWVESTDSKQDAKRCLLKGERHPRYHKRTEHKRTTKEISCIMDDLVNY
jgi:hypothetical protein